MSKTDGYRPTNIVVTHSDQARTFTNRNFFVDILALLFGISSSIGLTSVHVQLPLIVATAPEGWALPTYETIIVQSSNILTFGYLIYQYYSSNKLNESRMIYITLLFGCLAAMGMAYFHQGTIEIGGTIHSVAWMIFTFILAFVATISSVLFMPYMGRFRECYLITFICGQNLHHILPIIMALVQGIAATPVCIAIQSTNNDTNTTELIKQNQLSPRFNSEIFFLIVFGLLALSTIAFALLDNLAVCRDEFAPGTIIEGNAYYYNEADKNDVESGKVPDSILDLSHFNYALLTATIIAIGFFGNGVFPQFMSHSTVPYGFFTFHLTVIMIALAKLVGSFIAVFVSHTSIFIVEVLVIIALIGAIPITDFTLNSPLLPFVDSYIGSFIIVSC